MIPGQPTLTALVLVLQPVIMDNTDQKKKKVKEEKLKMERKQTELQGEKKKKERRKQDRKFIK